MAPHYKVTYFDLNAVGEPIRVLLSYGRLEFEDIRVKFKDWPALKPKMPYGQIPILECDGKVAHQHIAICRYLAKKLKLTGKDDWEDLIIDATVDTVNDLRTKIIKSYYEPDPSLRKKLFKTVLEETIPYYIEKLEAQARANGGFLAVPTVGIRSIHIYCLNYKINHSEMPYGQLPILEYDGKVAHQHIAICRYLAKKLKLTGKDDWEDLTIDSAVDTVNDLRIKIAEFYYEHDPAQRKKLKKPLLEETIPYYIEKLEAQAKANGGYLAVPKLTWADVYLTSLIDYMNALLDQDIIAKSANLQAVKNKVWSIPNVKKWMDKRPQTFKMADYPPPPE
nr:unnamed protein product [Callosobruchus analis]